MCEFIKITASFQIFPKRKVQFNDQNDSVSGNPPYQICWQTAGGFFFSKQNHIETTSEVKTGGSLQENLQKCLGQTSEHMEFRATSGNLTHFLN